MENKTHYRKVFKSDHLGIADLEDFIEEKKRLVFVIDHVNQEFGVMIAGRKGNHNIAYFKEKIKPLVLNATNSKMVKKFAAGSPFVEDWNNILVELYIDPNVKMKGEIVGGVRIKPIQPRLDKRELKPGMEEWKNAIVFLKGEGSIPQIKVKYKLSATNEQKLKNGVTV